MRTFVWTADEIRRGLGPDAALVFGAAYDVTDAGNWEGRTILRRVRADDELADAARSTPAEVADRLATARGRCSSGAPHGPSRPATTRRWRPGTAWRSRPSPTPRRPRGAGAGPDGERATAIARLATGAAERLLAALRRPGRPARPDRGRTAGRPARACSRTTRYLADGLLALYEATFDERWFVAARELADAILERFADPAGGFFDTADDHEALVARPKDLQDNALAVGQRHGHHASCCGWRR